MTVPSEDAADRPQQESGDGNESAEALVQQLQQNKPQIIQHSAKSLDFTPFDCKWIPQSASFAVVGQTPRGTGSLQVYSLSDGELQLKSQTEKTQAFKCSTIGASPLQRRQLATGSFDGHLQIWDLEHLDLPVYSTRAHEQIINCMDGIGGYGIQCGAPELVTGSRDGSVRVWDTRQQDRPVADIKGQQTRDCWTVAFGNSYNGSERCVAAGFDNGDLKVIDLRAMSVLYETNVKTGICSVEFDRRDILMNKLVVGGLEGWIHLFDLRTRHHQKGFASMKHKAHDVTTVWVSRHLPQNRDIFITSGGSGTLNLYKYKYPEKRSKKDEDGNMMGVTGQLQLLNHATMAEQPIGAFDWSPDKLGLCCFTAFDQQIRVGIVTRLQSF